MSSYAVLYSLYCCVFVVILLFGVAVRVRFVCVLILYDLILFVVVFVLVLRVCYVCSCYYVASM